MTDYREYIAKDRRLLILRILCDVPERRANQFVLRSALARHGYEEIVPTVFNDLLWLAKQGLVTAESLQVPSGDILLSTITDQGDLVARGISRVSGVAVPAV